MIRKTIKGGNFKPQMVGGLEFDQVPEEGSFNPVTSDGVAKMGQKTADSIAGSYVPGKSYAIGSIVEHEGSLYINYYGSITDSEWTPEHWTQTSIAELLSAIVKPQNVEKPKLNADIGDAVYADSLGNVHFIAGETVVSDGIPSGWEFVGVVALRKDNEATILHKNENTSVKWANCWLFRVQGLSFPLTAPVSMVMQQGPATGTTPVEVGTYTSSEGVESLDDFITDLDTWLQENPTVAGALSNYGWHATKMEDADGNDACFIVVDNISSQSRFSPVKSSTSGVTAPIYMWQFCGFNFDAPTINRKDGVNTYTVIFNKERFKAYDTSVNSPTDSLATAGIFNEADFDATTTVKAFYGTYDNYLDKMVPNESATTGAYGVFKGLGKESSKKLNSVKYTPLGGTETNVFKAIAFAESQKAHTTASVEGLNAGSFYYPGIDELFDILNQTNNDGSDPINSTLKKSLGEDFVNVSSLSYWVLGRHDISDVWLSLFRGYTSYSATGVMATNYSAMAIARYDLGD